MDTTPMPRIPLGRQLARRIRDLIRDTPIPAGHRLPSEADLATRYGVSRVTIRTALRTLESQGLIDVRHGSGSYVSDIESQVRAGLHELRSISETITEMGMVPGMQRHALHRRPVTEAEALKLGTPTDLEVVAVERMILADGTAVAYSYDVIPLLGIPDALVADFGSRSMFATFAEAGIVVRRAIAEVHAINDPAIGWGPQKPDPGLYVLLDQVHYEQRGRAVAHSRTYFVEGRFQFVVLRTS